MAQKEDQLTPVPGRVDGPVSGLAAARKAQSVPVTIGRPELLVDGSDRLFRRLIHGIFAFSALHEAIRDSYAAHLGLGGIQYTILQSIRHLGANQPVSVIDIAKHLHLSGSFITVETTKLKAAGLVKKQQATTDKRRVYLSVTRAGAALLNGIAPLQRTVNDVQFGDLTRKQFLDLLSMIERLTDSSRAALTLQHYLKAAKSNGGAEPLRAARRSSKKTPSRKP